MPPRDDEKNPETEPRAPGDSSAPRSGSAIPRLETASEMRGFPISPNGTALGVGPRIAGSDDELLEGEKENVSPEEAENIERLLREVDKDLDRLVPRAGRSKVPQPPRTAPVSEGSVQALSRDTINARIDRTATTSPGQHRRAAVPEIWKWIGLGCVIGVVSVFFMLHSHESETSPAAPATATAAAVPLAHPDTAPPSPTPDVAPVASSPSSLPAASPLPSAVAMPRHSVDPTSAHGAPQRQRELQPHAPPPVDSSSAEPLHNDLLTPGFRTDKAE